MLKFPCNNCGFGILVSVSQIGEPVLCKNCNTRQIVPVDVVPVIPEPLRPNAAPPLPYARITAPDYTATCVIAYMLIGFAILGMIASGFVAANAESIVVAISGCFTGTIIIALAMLLLRACDIAANTWHIRHGTLR